MLAHTCSYVDLATIHSRCDLAWLPRDSEIQDRLSRTTGTEEYPFHQACNLQARQWRSPRLQTARCLCRWSVQGLCKVSVQEMLRSCMDCTVGVDIAVNTTHLHLNAPFQQDIRTVP
jgi:hypothetical protein